MKRISCTVMIAVTAAVILSACGSSSTGRSLTSTIGGGSATPPQSSARATALSSTALASTAPTTVPAATSDPATVDLSRPCDLFTQAIARLLYPSASVAGQTHNKYVSICSYHGSGTSRFFLQVCPPACIDSYGGMETTIANFTRVYDQDTATDPNLGPQAIAGSSFNLLAVAWVHGKNELELTAPPGATVAQLFAAAEAINRKLGD